MAPENTRVSEPTDHLDLTDPDNMNSDAWPRYLVVEAKEENSSLSDVNPFIRAKALKGILGIDPKDTIFYRNSGILCVEVETRSQCKSLLNAKMFHTTPIKVTPHRTRNYTKGVFSCRDLAKMTEEDILHELQDINQPVVGIHRISSKKTGTLKPTDTFIVTFSTSVLPKDIKIGSLNVKVRPYIPNPRRCFNCQGYGHAKTKCQNKTVCAKCGQEGHEYETCTNDPHCLHCKGSHAASSRECPKYKHEKKIMELVYTEKITFYEAKQRVRTLVTSTNNNRLASDVVRSDFKKVEMKTIGVQTTLTQDYTHCPTYKCQGQQSASVQTLSNDDEHAAMETITPSAQGNKRRYENDEEDTPPSKSSTEDERSAHTTRERGSTNSPAHVQGAGESVDQEPGTQRTRSRSPIRHPGGSSHQGRRSPSRHKRNSNKTR